MDHNQTEKLLKAFDKIGAKPNMGKSFVRFTKWEKIPFDTIGELFGSMSVEDYIKRY